MGKSGSFFFMSHDREFLIKTMTTGDFMAFKKLFRAYFDHINMYEKSIISRIYGVYSVKMGEADPVYLMMQGNCKKCEDKHIKRVFDLKGSIVKRHVPGDDHKHTAVLKDVNFLEMKKYEPVMLFDQKRRNGIGREDCHSLQEEVILQIGKDITLLSHFNLMDYSLLTVIEYNPEYVRLFPEEFE